MVNSLDVFDLVGRFAAHDEYIEFEYVNGVILHKGVPCMDAVRGGQLIVTLEKTGYDNPYVHGIVLL